MKNLLLSILLLFIAGSSWGQFVIIGTGTSTSNGSSADPIERYYNYEHFQIVYTATELTAAGLPSGSIITGLGFSVSESAVSLANFTISMGLTTQTLAIPYISTGLAIVKNAFAYAPVVQTAGNFDMITFDANFTWDGTSSIVVNTCTGSNPYISPYGGLRYTAATSGAIRYIRTDLGSGNCAIATTTNSPNRPNIRFNYTANTACSGTPDPGNTLSSVNPVCPGVSFTLSLQNETPGSGVTYQWQSSPDGSDPWTNIGTSTSTYAVSQTAETYYRCEVTCEGNTGTSNPIQVTMNPWYNCYCVPTYSSGGNTDGMTLVTLGPLSQATAGNVSPYYYNYTSTQNAIPNLALGSTSNLSITFGSDPNQYSGAWIDFNQNGSFETTEFFTTNSNAGANGTAIISITVPSDATSGNTRMRIRGGDDSQPTSDKPCGPSNASYGQAQDYLVNIVGPSSLQGYVYDFEGNPIAGATIEKVGEISTTSNAGGDYLLTPLSAGSFDFKCSKNGYNDLVITLDIPINTTVNYNFILTQPQMDVEPGSIFAILGPAESTTRDLVITNNGNGPLGWNAEVQFVNNLGPLGPASSPLAYCAGSGGCDEFISNVTLGTINNNSVCAQYEDYTSLSTDLVAGQTYSISVLIGPPYYTGDQFGAWIDFDQNGIFDEPRITFTLASNLGTGTFTVPQNALAGPTTMRIRLDYNHVPEPCGATTYGEVEDYTVNIVDYSWIKLDIQSGTVPPFGGTQTVTATIDASKTPPVLAPGVTYTANILFTSPSGISPVTVPVTLVVTDGSLKGPQDLAIFSINEAEGKFMLKWKYFTIRELQFDHFVILRNGEMFATSTASMLEIVLSEPGTYCYQVYAVYEGGVFSDPSNELCFTWPMAPGVPLSNWALVLAGLLIGTYAFVMIRKRS